jgi:CheY-like chemotaxis protein
VPQSTNAPIEIEHLFVDHNTKKGYTFSCPYPYIQTKLETFIRNLALGKHFMTIEPDMKPMEILLIEDSPACVELVKEAFKECGRFDQLNVASDGLEALRFLRQQGKYAKAPRPDIILLDLNLPKKDGREVLAEIKTDKHLRLIPVIVLTTSDAERDIVTCYSLHANCYIVKPFGLEEFFAMIRSIERFWLTTTKLPLKQTQEVSRYLSPQK